MKKIRVMIVEDSAVVRLLLQHIIGGDPRFEVVAIAETAEEAMQLLEKIRPDVISLDIRLPGMNGLDATLRIMATRPTPIVVVSASVQSDDLNIAMNALRAGALTVVEKPVGTTHEEYDRVARHLLTQLEIMSQVKVVRQGLRRNLSFGAPAEEWPDSPPPRPPEPPAPRRAVRRVRMVGIVASTGGPNALSRLLGELPASFPAPILVVQHITHSFLDGFVSWLSTMTSLPVTVAQPGEEPRPGRIYLPPADRHLELRGGRLWAGSGSEVCSQRPSGTVLFQSIARDLGGDAVGVLLTGMGSDGAQGLLELRRAGGHTIAEDQSTAVIYGMPGVAAELGAACETLPLPGIAGRLLDLAANGAAAKEVAR